MALTAAQLSDMQIDLAISDDESVFTDEELERLFERSGSDYNLAVYYGWRQLLSASAKWVDYRVAQTAVSRGQAFDHILQMVAFWASESKSADDQLLSAGLNQVPTIHKRKPLDEYHHDGYFKRGRWYPYAR